MFYRPLRFFLLALAFSVVAAGLAALVFFKTGVAPDPFVLLMVPVALAAMVEGRCLAETYGACPETITVWWVALKMSVVTVMAAATVLFGLLIKAPELIVALSAVDLATAGLVVMVGLIMSWLTIRVGYGLGLKRGMRFSVRTLRKSRELSPPA